MQVLNFTTKKAIRVCPNSPFAITGLIPTIGEGKLTKSHQPKREQQKLRKKKITEIQSDKKNREGMKRENGGWPSGKVAG